MNAIRLYFSISFLLETTKNVADYLFNTSSFLPCLILKVLSMGNTVPTKLGYYFLRKTVCKPLLCASTRLCLHKVDRVGQGRKFCTSYVKEQKDACVFNTNKNQ